MLRVHRERISVILLLIILIIILGATITVAFMLRPDPVSENLKKDEVVKILVVFNDGKGNALSTNIVAYYPPSQKGIVFNILGNTGKLYASINRTDRIDAVYRELGINTYAEEITRITGLQIPFFAEISLESLGNMTDLLGGLKVFVRSPVDVLDSRTGERYLLPSGAVTLDGDKIQTFMMYKLADEGDAEQEERRQNTFLAFLEALHSNRAMLLDRSNFRTFEKFIHANVDVSALFSLVSHISNLNTDNTSLRTIAGNIRDLNGQKLLFPYEDADGFQFRMVAKQALSSLLQEGASNRVYVVEVQNGTRKPGLAANASNLLQNFGYDVLPPTDAPRLPDGRDYEHTAIISHIGQSEAVQALSDTINCLYIITEEVRPESEGILVGNKDFTLILGEDWNGRRVRGGYTGEASALAQ